MVLSCFCNGFGVVLFFLSSKNNGFAIVLAGFGVVSLWFWRVLLCFLAGCGLVLLWFGLAGFAVVL